MEFQHAQLVQKRSKLEELQRTMGLAEQRRTTELNKLRTMVQAQREVHQHNLQQYRVSAVLAPPPSPSSSNTEAESQPPQPLSHLVEMLQLELANDRDGRLWEVWPRLVDVKTQLLHEHANQDQQECERLQRIMEGYEQHLQIESSSALPSPPQQRQLMLQHRKQERQHQQQQQQQQEHSSFEQDGHGDEGILGPIFHIPSGGNDWKGVENHKDDNHVYEPLEESFHKQVFLTTLETKTPDEDAQRNTSLSNSSVFPATAQQQTPSDGQGYTVPVFDHNSGGSTNVYDMMDESVSPMALPEGSKSVAPDRGSDANGIAAVSDNQD